MKNKNNLLIVIVGVMMVIGIVGWWYINSNQSSVASKGTLFVSVTDATADINNVDEVKVQVEKVEIHTEAEGWTVISSNIESYNLLDLKDNGMTKLYVEEKVNSGIYDGVRVTVGNVTVKTKTLGDLKAYLPSNQITMDTVVNVKKDKDTHLILDFLADKSLHTTTNKKYVFAPAVTVISRSGAKVMVGEDGSVEALGGDLDSSINVGVDVDGTSKENFVLNSESGLVIDDTILGNVKFILGGKIYTNTGSTTINVN